jgi:DNA repair exonuclease SbcCD ATPase subunit
MSDETNYIDYLEEDDPIPGQLWVCISFLSPEGIRNCSIRGLKIRGVYGTKQEADERAAKLQKKDSNFHVFVGEVGKWLPWDPDPNDVEDQIYQEKELNKLMKGYKDNMDNAKKMQQQRKDDMLKQAATEEKSKKEQIVERLRKKHAAKKQQQKEISDTSQLQPTTKETEIKIKEEEIKTKEKLIKSEKQRLDKIDQKIDEKKQSLETIESKLAKIQELYEKMNYSTN